jgi:hypothetical protein
MRHHPTSLLTALFALAFALSVGPYAQIAVEQKIPPVRPAPRTSDGKPDFSGVWGVPDRAPGLNTTKREESVHIEKLYGKLQSERPSRTPWAEEIFLYNDDPRKSKDTVDGDFGAREELNPAEHCVPYGPSLLVLSGGGISIGGAEFIQSRKRLLIFYEQDSTIRQIWIDGRGHPPADELEPTFMGHSIGKWEGDTLVIDTVGLRNEPWLDGGGNVSSKQLHMVERYQRLDHDTMKIELTLDDPVALTKPWVRRGYRRLRNWDLAEDLRCWPGSEALRSQQDTFYFRRDQ